MTRPRLRLVVLLVLSGILTAIAASLIMGMVFALLDEGPSFLLAGLQLGASVIHFGLFLATLPAILFGSLLWLRGVRQIIAWASMGVLAGFACLALAYIGPDQIGQITAHMLSRQPLAFSASFAITGALTALVFLALMRLFTAIARR